MAIYARLSLLIMGMTLVNSQLSTCREDSQCSSGLFCDTNAYSCIQCVSCKEYRREPHPIFNESICLKSLEECGPCFKGLVKVYQEGSIRADCMSPDAQVYYKNWSHLVLWSAAMIASVIVIGTFVQVLRNTNINKIHMKVFYYTYTFLRRTPIDNKIPSLPPTYNFNTALSTNTVSSIGFDYVTPTETKYFNKIMPVPHKLIATDYEVGLQAVFSAREDVITELNAEKLGRYDVNCKTSLVRYEKNESKNKNLML